MPQGQARCGPLLHGHRDTLARGRAGQELGGRLPLHANGDIRTTRNRRDGATDHDGPIQPQGQGGPPRDRGKGRAPGDQRTEGRLRAGHLGRCGLEREGDMGPSRDRLRGARGDAKGPPAARDTRGLPPAAEAAQAPLPRLRDPHPLHDPRGPHRLAHAARRERAGPARRHGTVRGPAPWDTSTGGSRRSARPGTSPRSLPTATDSVTQARTLGRTHTSTQSRTS